MKRGDLRSEPRLIQDILEKKCESKSVSVPTLESIQNASTKAELISEWENMLGHQLHTLPPFNDYWKELPNIFNWLTGTFKPVALRTIPVKEKESYLWTPPPTIWQWGLGIPFESIRFAAVNHLCVELYYRKENGEYSNPIIEPYSLRKTKDGNLTIYAVKTQSSEVRAYCVDRVQNIKVTNKVFKPRYQIEFSSSDNIHAAPTKRSSKNKFRFAY